MSSSDSSPRTPGSFQQAVLPYLTKIAHGTTPFITTFLLIHLSAPVFANIGGSSLASQVMLLGREYYQTPFGEKYLVKAPIIIHALASIAKRLLSPSKRPPRPLYSLLTATGYGTFFIFLPVHYFTHRVYPSLPSAPIFAVGPSELDYEFVKVGIQTFPWRSWGLYVGLVLCVAIHFTEGISIMWNMWLRNQLGRLRKRTARFVAAGAAIPVISGLFFLSREPLMTFTSLAERFEAAFTKSVVYRF